MYFVYLRNMKTFLRYGKYELPTYRFNNTLHYCLYKLVLYQSYNLIQNYLIQQNIIKFELNK